MEFVLFVILREETVGNIATNGPYSVTHLLQDVAGTVPRTGAVVCGCITCDTQQSVTVLSLAIKRYQRACVSCRVNSITKG
jgi:hypothetical protein